MAKFTLNNIQFEADNSTLKKAGQKTTKFGNYNNYDFDGVDETNIEKFVNAVEIDWNAAQLGEETISNSYESHCSMIVPSIAA